MPDQNLTLPLLPLTTGVVLPGMVFTMALESEEAKAAAEAAGTSGGRLLLVPHIEGRYASVGVVAEVLEQGELPGGLPAIVVRGDQRASIGTGVPGTGQALWVEAEPLVETEPTTAVSELAREYRAVLENILLSRGAARVAAQLREVTEPGTAGRRGRVLARPHPGPEGRGPRDRRRRGAPAPGAGLGPRHPGRPGPARADQDRRGRGHGAHPARVPAPPPARGDQKGAGPAGRGRRRRPGRLPGQGGQARPAGQGGRGRRARGRPPRADQ